MKVAVRRLPRGRRTHPAERGSAPVAAPSGNRQTAHADKRKRPRGRNISRGVGAFERERDVADRQRIGMRVVLEEKSRQANNVREGADRREPPFGISRVVTPFVYIPATFAAPSPAWPRNP